MKIIILILSLNLQPIMGKLGAYVFYEDAQCYNSNKIEGTFIYAYDNSQMRGKGFVKSNYYGPCKYFEGGYFDFMYQNQQGNGGGGAGSYMKNGYCITCNGMIGCTSVEDDCSYFQTSIPNNIYTSTGNQQDTNKYTSSSNGGSEGDKVDYELAAQVEYAVYQEANSFASQNAFEAVYALIGVFGGLVSLFSLYTSIKGIKRLRLSKASVDTSEFLKDLGDDIKVINGVTV